MRVLITGATGQLGGYLLRAAERRGWDIVAWRGRATDSEGDVRAVDLADHDAVDRAFSEANPRAIVHAGAMASVADCFRDPERARQVNVQGTAALAELAARSRARFVYVSTDLVFDGVTGGYREDSPISPLSIYGRTKADAEQAARTTSEHVVARVSLMFGPSLTARHSFFDQQLAALRQGRPIDLFIDEWRTPIDLDTAARALVDLAESDYTGCVHVGGPERMSRFEMGRRLAASLGVRESLVRGGLREAAQFSEPRPGDCSLDSACWRSLFPASPWPRFEEAVRSILAQT